jgi:mono/diheme cytochrome c family protein
MNRPAGSMPLAAIASVAWATLAAGEPPIAAPDYVRDIRPIFEQHCYSCHGAEKQTSSYRLDVRDVALKGGDSGEPAIVPHKAAESAIIRHVSEADPHLRMPPADSGVPPLSAEQIATLAAWINAGPSWPDALAGSADDGRMDHWAWKPVRRPDVPAGDAAHPIDRFLLVAPLASGKPLAPPADPRTIVRRLTYDLTGLPPAAEDVAAFSADPSPAAYDALVTRLLDSPRYGERWGRKWLDVVRYADTAGDTADFPVMDAWRYRNWVIDAFKRDLPYDEFLRQQLAGDILANGPPDERNAGMITATGYWALARRFGADGDKDMHLTYDDAIDNLGKAVLGLSIACARCHDHKYDPITARDYYGLYGMLASTTFAYPGTELKPTPRDMVPIMSAAEQQLMSEWSQELSRLEAEISRCDRDARAQAEAVAARDAHLANRVPGRFAYAVREGDTPANARILLRGDPEKLGAEVPRKNLDLFGGETVQEGSGRKELAAWLCRGEHPLTARVMINRLWQGHFGRGIVGTPNDFGVKGQPPTHPELLDWLADEFVRQGFSVKAMHRLIVTSAAYRQQSGTASAYQLARRRLDAEEIRDTLLDVAGELDLTPGAAHPFRATSGYRYSQHKPFAEFHDSKKRSVYLLTLRLRRHPMLGLFDGADPNATTPGRDVSTVPTQALYFLNDSFFHGCAEAFARRVTSVSGDEGGRLDAACQLAFQRPATDPEQARASRFLADLAGAAAEAPQAERSIAAWAALARVLLGSNEFVTLD